MQEKPDLLIPLITKNISLVLRVSSSDGRLYQAYFGSKLDNTDNLAQIRDAGHLAYATFGLITCLNQPSGSLTMTVIPPLN